MKERNRERRERERGGEKREQETRETKECVRRAVCKAYLCFVAAAGHQVSFVLAAAAHDFLPQNPKETPQVQ